MCSDTPVHCKACILYEFMFMVKTKILGLQWLQTLIYYTMFRPRCVISGGWCHSSGWWGSCSWSLASSRLRIHRRDLYRLAWCIAGNQWQWFRSRWSRTLSTMSGRLSTCPVKRLSTTSGNKQKLSTLLVLLQFSWRGFSFEDNAF